MSITLDEFQQLLLAPWMPVHPSTLSTTTLPKNYLRFASLSSAHSHPTRVVHNAPSPKDVPPSQLFSFLNSEDSWALSSNLPHFAKLSDIIKDFDEYSDLTQSFFLVKAIPLYDPITPSHHPSSSSSSGLTLEDPFAIPHDHPKAKQLTGLQKKIYESLPVPLNASKNPDNFVGYLLLFTDTQNIWISRVLSPDSKSFQQFKSTNNNVFQTGVVDLFLQRNWHQARPTQSTQPVNKMDTVRVKSEQSMNQIASQAVIRTQHDHQCGNNSGITNLNTPLAPTSQSYTNSDSFYFPYPKALFNIFDPGLHHNLAKFTPNIPSKPLTQSNLNPNTNHNNNDPANSIFVDVPLPTSISWGVGALPFHLLPPSTQQFYSSQPSSSSSSAVAASNSTLIPPQLPLIFQCEYQHKNLPRHWTFVAIPFQSTTITVTSPLPPTTSQASSTTTPRFEGFKKQSHDSAELQAKGRILEALLPSQYLPTAQRIAFYSNFPHTTTSDQDDQDAHNDDRNGFDSDFDDLFGAETKSTKHLKSAAPLSSSLDPCPSLTTTQTRESVNDNFDRLAEPIIFELSEPFVLSQLLAIPMLSQINLFQSTLNFDFQLALSMIGSGGGGGSAVAGAARFPPPLHSTSTTPSTTQCDRQSSLFFIPHPSQLQLSNPSPASITSLNNLTTSLPTALPSVFPTRFYNDSLSNISHTRPLIVSPHHHQPLTKSLNIPIKRAPLALQLNHVALHPLFSTGLQNSIHLTSLPTLHQTTTAIETMPAFDSTIKTVPTPAHFFHSTILAHLYPALSVNSAEICTHFLTVQQLYKKQDEFDRLEHERREEEQQRKLKQQQQALEKQHQLAQQEAQEEQLKRAQQRMAKQIKHNDVDDFVDTATFPNPFDDEFGDFDDGQDDDDKKKSKTRKNVPTTTATAQKRKKVGLTDSDDDFRHLGASDSDFDEYQPKRGTKGIAPEPGAKSTKAVAKSTKAVIDSDDDDDDDEYGDSNLKLTQAGVKKNKGITTTALSRSSSTSDSTKKSAPPPAPKLKSATPLPPAPPSTLRPPPAPPRPGGARKISNDDDDDAGLIGRRRKF